MIGDFKWLKSKFARQSAIIDANEPQSPGLVQSYEQGQDIPMPDIYACDDTIPLPQLNILDESSPDDNESTGSGDSTGVSPYNTG